MALVRVSIGDGEPLVETQWRWFHPATEKVRDTMAKKTIFMINAVAQYLD